MIKNLVLSFIIVVSGVATAHAQKVLDEVVAVVGNEVVLLSDVEAQLVSYKETSKEKQAIARCYAIDQLIQKKMLLNRAKYDSLKINDEQVENELNRRMAFFIQQYGSEDAIEKFYHKTVLEIKADFRDAVKDQILEEQMQGKVVNNIEPTPEEITKFYNSIPKDSLPYLNTELEIGQILIYPQPSKSDKQKVIDRLMGMKRDILAGNKSFSTQALLYSEDPSAVKNKGDMGWQRADNFVPEFAAAALSLKKDSISDPIETKYGFHIIKLLGRRGDIINVQHILRRAEVGQDAIIRAKKVLDSLRTETLKGKRDSLFAMFALNYSQDQDTKNRGGLMIDQKTNSSHIPVDELDAISFDAIDKLKVGDISMPLYYRSQEGKEGYRIMYLKSKNAPHKANLKDDYPKIKQMASENKKAQQLDIWFRKYVPTTYIRINPTYDNCKNLAKWHKNSKTEIIGN